MRSFLQRFATRVIGVLNGFDRLRFRGTLRSLAYAKGLAKFLGRSKVLLKDYKPYVESVTSQVKQDVTHMAESAQRPVVYLPSASLSKEEKAQEIARADGVEQGLVCVLSALECCHSFEIRGNGSTKRLELVPAYRKCLHYYAYWIDPQCGWMHTRLQTWFPFSMWTCLNGREWLCRQLEQAGVGYTRRDNCLTQVADLDRARQLIQQQLQTDWPQLLASFADRIFPRRFSLLARERQDYYWTLDESEWATDVMFHSSRQLAAIYPQLVQHALSVFTSRDILRFLGRAIPPDGDGGRFAGEASGDLRFRPEGMRVKHRINRNSLKMYDKQGSVLRIETTINDPADFRVYRTKEGDEAGKPEWRPMRKGVSDIHRRAKVSQQANERYLEGLAAAKATEPLSQLVDPLCQPTTYHGRRARGLNPFSGADARLLQAVSQGEFLLQGFRNRDLQAVLYPQPTEDPLEARRRSAAVTRQLRLLRAHGLIRKLPKQHRYRPTPAGQLAITALLAARKADTQTLTAAA
ncbi:MAG: hypothetical protein U0935_07010 [Pirellulales bacterium]